MTRSIHDRIETVAFRWLEISFDFNRQTIDTGIQAARCCNTVGSVALKFRPGLEKLFEGDMRKAQSIQLAVQHYQI